MSTLRHRLAFALASLVLAVAAAGCHKDSPAESDEGDEPSETASTGVEDHEIARSLGLDATQEAKLVELDARGGRGGGHHHHGGRNHGARIERRVEKISRALGLTPQQSEKLRAIFQQQAARAERRHAMMTPGAEDPRFSPGGGEGPQGPQGGWRFRRGGPQGGPEGPQGGWRSRRGGRGQGFPQGGPDDPQGPPPGGRQFRHGGQGFPQGGPDEPQGPPGPQGPDGPEGPMNPSDI